MFPIVLLLGLGITVYAASRQAATSHAPTAPSRTVVSGYRQDRSFYHPEHRNPQTLEYRRAREELRHVPREIQAPAKRRPTALEMVLILMKEGHRPAQWLVARAMEEAIAHKRYDIVHKLNEFVGPAAFETQGTGTKTGQDSTDDLPRSSNGEVTEDDGPSNTDLKSPLDGVDDDSWSFFLEALKTQKPDFKSDRHIGSYHQSLERIRQLGLTPPSNEGEQLQALVTDLEDCRDSGALLLRQWCGDVVNVGGKEVPITESGLLGVMKTAGVAKTEDWLKNPKDRTKFKMTTDTFLKTNGIF